MHYIIALLFAAGIVYFATGISPLQILRIQLRANNKEQQVKIKEEFGDLLQ
jgi:uncharacterized membrane protein YciS (DUF1049 family)